MPESANLPTLADLAALALNQQRAVSDHLLSEPVLSTDDARWRRWAERRDHLVTAREAAAQALLVHPEYRAAHRKVWHDDLTANVRAMSVWAPVARRVVQPVPRVGG